ncbi:MAG: hypothetical protein P8P29_03300 [Flavobacteriaceae bacterium]|nr:hypothetical protein [Flavobacteriaceae bacterium]
MNFGLTCLDVGELNGIARSIIQVHDNIAVKVLADRSKTHAVLTVLTVFAVFTIVTAESLKAHVALLAQWPSLTLRPFGASIAGITLVTLGAGNLFGRADLRF